MRYLALLVSLFLLAASAHADRFILAEQEVSGDTAGLSVRLVPTWDDLKAFGTATGVYPGDLPAVVDTDAKLWLPIFTASVASVVAEFSSTNTESRLHSVFVARQDAKPLLRRTLENDFFSFIRLVLLTSGDPRKDLDPTPKLGFEELTPLIEEIQVSNPMAAVNLTLKGLSIDSALKRFSATWWDDAQEHTIPVEE